MAEPGVGLRQLIDSLPEKLSGLLADERSLDGQAVADSASGEDEEAGEPLGDDAPEEGELPDGGGGALDDLMGEGDVDCGGFFAS